MGIYQLNRFLQSKCRDSIKKIHMSTLKNKTIVIDTSIYMYKYAKTESIIEGMYRMIITLLHFEIKPIFIFDGKPPKEKYKLLDKRRERKKEAENKYNSLKKKLLNSGKTENVIQQDSTLKKYKSEFIKINRQDIDEVKNLIKLFGIEYYTADEEADSMCVEIVKSKKAWGCLSEDTDMFVYGCPYILRYASFINENVILYDYGKILNQLHMKHDDFVEMCILSGTDYNSGIDNIFKIYTMYNRYKKEKIKKCFSSWIMEYTNKSTDLSDLSDIQPIKDLFNTSPKIANSNTDLKSNSTSNEICINKIKEFLKQYNFIFIGKPSLDKYVK